MAALWLSAQVITQEQCRQGDAWKRFGNMDVFQEIAFEGLWIFLLADKQP
ncbi:hypothetical protein MHLNE_15740 [Moorella humiferrea]